MKNHPFNPAFQKFLTKLLNHLLELENIHSWSLMESNQQILSSNQKIQNDLQELPFNEYKLLLNLENGYITPEIQRYVKSMAQLARVVGANLGSDASIKSSVFIKTYLDILTELENKKHTLNFYDEILNLNKKILLASDLFGVLQSIMDMSCNACKGEGSSLLLVDDKTGEMFFNVVSGEKKSQLKEIRIPEGEGIAGHVVKTAQPEIINDVGADERSFQRVDKVLNYETRDMIIAPIIAHGKVTGVIEVINSKNKHGFLQEDLSFLINIASHTSLFIENIKAKEALLASNYSLDRKNSEINTLFEIGQSLNTSLDPEVLKNKLLTTLLKVLNIKYGAILEIKNKNLIQTYHGNNNENSVRHIQNHIQYEAVTDILLWLKNYKEPFFFRLKDGTQNALAGRFLEANQALMQDIPGMDLWIPVFNEHNDILFIISIHGSQFNREMPVNDVKFFQGIMNTCFTIFRNVSSYNNAIESTLKEEHIRKEFQKYVPARVISSLIEQKDPQPVQQIVSVLFADIRDFTQLTERMEPYKLVNFLNQYFEIMVEAITLHKGIVDKFMGDSIMAIFGFPDPGPNDASNALNAAAEMQKRLKILNLNREIIGETNIRMGIGLHTGQIIAGNIGSHNRIDFTIIGDTVNLAARLEKAVKFYKIPMLFTHETRQAAMQLPSREIDLIRVRGRNASVQVYEPLYNIALNQNKDQFLEKWKQAIALYRKSSFNDAKYLFQEIYEMTDQADPVSELYIQRCDQMIKNPSLEFDPVFDLQ